VKPVALTETEITKLVEVLFGQTHYNAANKTLDLPVLLKNTSKEIIYGPVRFEVVAVGGVYEWEDAEEDKKFAPQMLNASNEKPAAGAHFDFTLALGTDGALNPGAISSPVVWRLKLVDPTRVPSIQLRIIGQVEKERR
jgi:hypothetical protein